MFVHDLNQIVTVQLLEETPAVLSLGKLCKDHGYYQWVSGQEPRLTKNGKSIISASSSSDSVLERSDELATRRLGQESLRSDKKDENDPLADMPFWFEDFTASGGHRIACTSTVLRTQIRNFL